MKMNIHHDTTIMRYGLNVCVARFFLAHSLQQYYLLILTVVFRLSEYIFARFISAFSYPLFELQAACGCSDVFRPGFIWCTNDLLVLKVCMPECKVLESSPLCLNASFASSNALKMLYNINSMSRV